VCGCEEWSCEEWLNEELPESKEIIGIISIASSKQLYSFSKPPFLFIRCPIDLL